MALAMSMTNLALYRLLVHLGAPEVDAAAASTVDPAMLATLVTKQDLAEFEARLAWKIGALIVGAMVSMTGIFAVIVGWLVRH